MVPIEVVPADRWADTVAGRLADRLSNRPSLRLCLPTGSTPAPVYAAFAAHGGSMADATILLLDEFVLPPGSAGRCDVMLERDLLQRLERPPRDVVVWDTTNDPGEASIAMEREIAAGLDLAILGLGTNGHVGINEPGSPADSRSRLVELAPSTADGVLAYGAEQVPTHGLTLGIGTLLDAQEIWLLVTGAHKRTVLEQALHGPVTTELPASLLRDHPRFVVVADDAAWPDVRS
jgi:glucosamine-6-phosphate deaminase